MGKYSPFVIDAFLLMHFCSAQILPNFCQLIHLLPGLQDGQVLLVVLFSTPVHR